MQLDEIGKLLSDARPRHRVLFYCASSLLLDCSIFHFRVPVSGHSYQAKHYRDVETDGMDEAIFPLDYKVAGCITDQVGRPILFNAAYS